MTIAPIVERSINSHRQSSQLTLGDRIELLLRQQPDATVRLPFNDMAGDDDCLETGVWVSGLLPSIAKVALRGDLETLLLCKYAKLDITPQGTIRPLVLNAYEIAASASFIPTLGASQSLARLISQLSGFPVKESANLELSACILRAPNCELSCPLPDEDSSLIVKYGCSPKRNVLSREASRVARPGQFVLAFVWEIEPSLDGSIVLYIPIPDKLGRDPTVSGVESGKIRIDLGNRAGYRVSTTQAVKAGEVVYTARDVIFFPKPTYQTVQVGSDTHVLEVVLAHLNHSCNPTAFINAEDLTIVAERDLKAGEEITFFYAANEWLMDRPFQCKCGAADCVGRMSGAAGLGAEALSGRRLNEHIRRQLGSKLDTF